MIAIAPAGKAWRITVKDEAGRTLLDLPVTSFASWSEMGFPGRIHRAEDVPPGNGELFVIAVRTTASSDDEERRSDFERAAGIPAGADVEYISPGGLRQPTAGLQVDYQGRAILVADETAIESILRAVRAAKSPEGT